VRHGASIDGGPKITADLIHSTMKEELAKVRSAVGEDAYAKGQYAEAAHLFAQVALSKDFVEFLTLPGYERLD
jgi:malate synthase